jgi:hypothetical protein
MSVPEMDYMTEEHFFESLNETHANMLHDIKNWCLSDKEKHILATVLIGLRYSDGSGQISGTKDGTL